MDNKKQIVVSVCLVVLALIIAGGIIFSINRETADNPEHFITLGERYLTELNFEQAIVQFARVIEIEPMNIRAYLGVAEAYLHLDQIDNSANVLINGIDATNNENLAWALVGVQISVVEGFIAIAEALESEGLFDRALELLYRAYQLTGDDILGRKLGIVEASKLEFRDNYAIVWQDTAFEQIIRQYLGRSSGDIYYYDVKLIEEILVWGEFISTPDVPFSLTSHSINSFRLSDGREGEQTGQVKSLLDLEHFTSLQRLTVAFQVDLDISALGDTQNIDNLRRIELLNLVGNGITDISVVSNLYSLRHLQLARNNIVDISPISMLIELQSVGLNNNQQLSSAEPLRGLRRLRTVNISHIENIDLSVFVGLPELRNMNLVNVGSVDYGTLPLLSLDYLEVTANDSNFPIILQISTLTRLRLHGEGRRNVETQEHIQGLTNILGIGLLTNLISLDLLAHNLQDISPLISLPIERLELSLRDDIDLSPLITMPNLESILIAHGINDDLFERVTSLLPHVEVTRR